MFLLDITRGTCHLRCIELFTPRTVHVYPNIRESDVRHVPTASRPASLLHFGWCRFVGVRRVTAARNSRTSGMLLGQVHVGKLWVWV